MRQEREAIANHEAGHAAVAWLCGFETEFVNMHATYDRKGGVKLILTGAHLAAVSAGDVDATRRRIFVFCAGLAADYHHAHGVGFDGVLEGYNNDRENAEELMAHIGDRGDNLFLKYAIFVCQLMDHFGWEVVDRVAAILLERDELTRDEMDRLRATKGTFTPETTALASQALK